MDSRVKDHSMHDQTTPTLIALCALMGLQEILVHGARVDQVEKKVPKAMRVNQVL